MANETRSDTSGIDQWNERFSGEGYLFGEEPNAFLRSQAPRLVPGSKALAVADGEGRNGVWLAQQGLQVTSVDASLVALAKAKALASRRGVAIATLEADLGTWAWPEAAYDLVAAIFIQFARPGVRAGMFEGMKATLRPGGLLLLQGYRPEQLDYGTGGPRIIENLYTEDLLRRAFADLEILELNSHDGHLDEGSAHVGPSALIDLVATKPR
jgi:SAM-dependent methyltransferase